MSLSAGRVGVRADQVDSFGRVISPSFLNEIMEDLPEWTDLPVRVNGTEELIPSNPSVPVTSPILADIDYPDVRRNNQYFTYRESPTSVDGLAKIKSIKGNTLVWNQLVQNGNFASTSNWATSNATLSVASNKATLTVTRNATIPFYQTINQRTVGHTYLILFNAYASRSLNITVNWGVQLGSAITLTTSNQRFSVLTVMRTGGNNNFNLSAVAQTGDVINYSNVCVFDLTQMFGAGKEPTAEQFTSLFSLSYYTYNTGTLLNFNGTGIKTVEFNLFDPTSETINAYLKEITSNNVRWSYEADSRSVAIRCFPNTTYCVYANGLMPSILRVCSIAEELPSGTGWDIQCEKQFVNSTTGMTIFTTGANAKYLIVQSNKATFENVKANLCISVSGDKNGTYEPYTENTTNLPIQTYFPTGMKSAETVYDELAPTKAVTRIGAVDLGSLSWYYTSGGQGRFASGSIASSVKPVSANTQVANIKCVKYSTISAGSVYNGNVGIAIDNTGAIWVYDTAYGTDAGAFKTAVSGIYLYYELATPVELPTLSFE